jgi:hypothetical protein
MKLTLEQHRKIVDKIDPDGRNPRYRSVTEATQLGLPTSDAAPTIAEAHRRYEIDFAAAEKELRAKGEL